MSEITINKHNKSITFINNGIAFSQFGVADEILDLITNLQTQLQQKENIIKEVREKINNYTTRFDVLNYQISDLTKKELLEILDKEGKDNE